VDDDLMEQLDNEQLVPEDEPDADESFQTYDADSQIGEGENYEDGHIMMLEK
jgi:hypothetical protein